jgi:hypothetical protein
MIERISSHSFNYQHYLNQIEGHVPPKAEEGVSTGHWENHRVQKILVKDHSLTKLAQLYLS